MQLSIPETIIQSIRLPENRIEAELLKELALALYAQELLSFGKARELANLDHRQFKQGRGVTDDGHNLGLLRVRFRNNAG